MLRFFVIVSIAVALVASAKVKNNPRKQTRADAKAQPTEIVEGVGQVIKADINQHIAEAGHAESRYESTPNIAQHISHGGHGEPTYASGAELSSIAHNSALQAQQAVQGQESAGNQADFNAKSSLAQAALGAASTAQAALVGKQVIVQGLQHELHDAEKQVLAEIAHYQQTQKAALAAHEAEQQAQAQVDALSAALLKAKESAQGASQVASQAAGTVAAQHSMIQEAKHRLAHVSEKLHHALADLHETETSAKKAAEAAQQAQANAAAAANSIAANAEKNLVHSKSSDFHK